MPISKIAALRKPVIELEDDIANFIAKMEAKGKPYENHPKYKELMDRLDSAQKRVVINRLGGKKPPKVVEPHITTPHVPAPHVTPQAVSSEAKAVKAVAKGGFGGKALMGLAGAGLLYGGYKTLFGHKKKAALEKLGEALYIHRKNIERAELAKQAVEYLHGKGVI